MATIKEQLRPLLRRDGKDHVNVHPEAETELGRLCSVDWKRRFHVPHIGDFGSAKCFAAWLICGGDESLRFSGALPRNNASSEEYRTLVLFGKYYQLLGSKEWIAQQRELLELPWTGYRQHLTGVQEFDRWFNYADHVREIALDVVEENSGAVSVYERHTPHALSILNNYLKKIAGERFRPYESLDAMAHPKPTLPESQDDAKPAGNVHPLHGMKAPRQSDTELELVMDPEGAKRDADAVHAQLVPTPQS
jgi:hypothetical protein